MSIFFNLLIACQWWFWRTTHVSNCGDGATLARNRHPMTSRHAKTGFGTAPLRVDQHQPYARNWIENRTVQNVEHVWLKLLWNWLGSLQHRAGLPYNLISSLRHPGRPRTRQQPHNTKVLSMSIFIYQSHGTGDYPAMILSLYLDDKDDDATQSTVP